MNVCRKKGVEGGGSLDLLEGFTEADEEAIALLERQQHTSQVHSNGWMTSKCRQQEEERTKKEEVLPIQRPKLKMKPITFEDEGVCWCR